METRRIQSVGKGSYSVSLPKEWITHNNLKEKDIVFIENLNNALIIEKKYPKSDRKSISIESQKIRNLKEFIRMCYIKGINNLKISFLTKSEKETSKIKDILERFSGYYISNEDDKTLEISFIFKEVDISLEKIMKRAVYVINQMPEQLRKKDFRELGKLENSVDSLNNLSKKILFACMENKTYSIDNKVKDVYQMYTYLELVRQLERVADCIFSFMKTDYSIKDLENLEEIISFLDNVIKIKKRDVKELENYVFASDNREIDATLKRLKHLFEGIEDVLDVLEMDNSFFNEK